MAVSIGKFSIELNDLLSRVSEIELLNYYFGIKEIPCIVSSPLRIDNHPSFGFYSKDGKRIYWTDFSNKTHGGIFDLLGMYWGESYNNVLVHIWEDLPNITGTNGHIIQNKSKITNKITYDPTVDLQCKVREWKDYDIEYWNNFGISIEWLKFADVYPISHKIIVKESRRIVFPADKYAYAYVEYKDNKVTLKIYQPFNKVGFKWSNKHNKSVLSLWTKIPEFGERVCICSSLKDALCLWSNVGIPSIAVQGEGYEISNTAISELKTRYKEVYILFDNDKTGLIDGKKLAEQTGFTNLVLPQFDGGKDVSDLYHILKNKKQFKEIISSLFDRQNV